jgi:hypothetical protein
MAHKPFELGVLDILDCLISYGCYDHPKQLLGLLYSELCTTERIKWVSVRQDRWRGTTQATTSDHRQLLIGQFPITET